MCTLVDIVFPAPFTLITVMIFKHHYSYTNIAMAMAVVAVETDEVLLQ